MKRKLFAIIFLVFLLSGCSREVENEEIVININGIDVNGEFTGTLTDNLATGEGVFVASEENGGWKYTGVFDNSIIKEKGSISGYSYELNISDNTISVIYEGECINGIPNGIGKVNGKVKGGNTFEYSGDFVDGNINGNGNANNYPYTVVYNDENILGLYSGSLINGIPNGEGTFHSINDDIAFDYQGTWDNGELSGKGNLLTNHYIIEFSDVTRIGNYEGNVENGQASGEGVFVAVTDEGNEYKYTGMFKNGTFNGYGERVFTDEKLNLPAYRGTYTDGDFTPTKSELLEYVGGIPDFVNFDVLDESKRFIEEHEDLFLAEDKSLLEGLHNNDITMNELYKKPKKYSETIVSVSNCRIIQIMEEEVYGHTITWFICNDKNNNRVFAFADSELPNVNKNSRVRVYGLPIGIATYKNGFGASTSAYAIFVSYIE